ncbi:MAG: polysaccharide deacetylase family protein [Calditrichia bacterium]
MIDEAVAKPDKVAAIPILMYHKIDSQNEVGINAVSPSLFKTHIQWLRDNHYATVTFNDLADNLELPKKPIILTFDDAYQSVFTHAFPIMQELEMRGVVYALSGFLGKENTWDVNLGGITFKHMTAEELCLLNAAGWEVGGHSVTHRGLTLLPANEVKRELLQDKQELEDVLGCELVSFAYPFGLHNNTVCQLVREVGYQYGCRSLRGGLHSLDKLRLPRIPIYQFDGPTSLQRKLEMRHTSFEYLKLLFLSAPAVLTPFYQKLFKRHLFLDM